MKWLYDMLRRQRKLLFGKHLFWTNTISSGLLMVVGDMMAQEIEMRNKKKWEKLKKEAEGGSRYDTEKVFNMGLVGLSQGPMHHYIYKWMDQLIPGSCLKSVTYKILIDQFVNCPLYITQFYYFAGFLEKKTLEESTEELKQKFWKIYIADWSVWPVAQFFNFYYLPGPYRVLFINFITMFYNILICYVKHMEVEMIEENDDSEKVPAIESPPKLD